jgi:hypothetical protein
VLGEEREQILLADTELPTKAINVKFAALNPPANGLAGYANLGADFLNAEKTLNVRGSDHDFESCFAIGEGDEPAFIDAMATWRPSRLAKARSVGRLAESGFDL